jgi:histone acetyltransferase MYST1
MTARRGRPKLPAFAKGTRHWVKQQTGMPCLAEIVDTRTNSQHSSQEYYIHYCNFDKRLDEWIGEERFLTPKQVKELGEEYFRDEPDIGVMTRNLKRRFSDSFSSPVLANNTIVPTLNNNTAALDPIMQQLEKEHEEATKVKNIQRITFGCWEIDCWYFSPFPDDYSHVDHLYFCERCLKYMQYEQTLARHLPICPYSGPPGSLIYLNGNLAVYEMDGECGDHKLYCQNLCLLAKLFLDHKTIYYDVSPFKFYVICELEEEPLEQAGSSSSNKKPTKHSSDECVHPVGFFSKEKNSADNYNLACIMVLPPHQRKGYGRFLMSLSYELSRREGIVGSPEKPLSDLGLVSYQRFWGRDILLKLTQTSTVEGLSKKLAFTVSDVEDTLERLGLLRQAANGKKSIVFNARLVKELLSTKFALKPGQVELVPDALSWPQTHRLTDSSSSGTRKK